MISTRTKVWSDLQILNASDLNAEFNNLLNAPGIVNADISASAAIAPSKINVTFPTGSIVGTTDTQTFTNKRNTRRVTTAADGTSFTPSADNEDETKQLNTQVTGTLTINNPTGTPTDGQGLIVKVKSTNSQTYAYGTQFKGGTTTLPVTHAGASKYDYLGFIWNADSSTWDLVGLMQAIG